MGREHEGVDVGSAERPKPVQVKMDLAPLEQGEFGLPGADILQ